MKYKWSIDYSIPADIWVLEITRTHASGEFDEIVIRRSYATESDAGSGLILIRTKLKAGQNHKTGEFEV